MLRSMGISFSGKRGTFTVLLSWLEGGWLERERERGGGWGGVGGRGVHILVLISWSLLDHYSHNMTFSIK